MRRLAEFGDPDGLSELLTGCDSEVSVSKAFRRQFGVVPGAYRKSRTTA